MADLKYKVVLDDSEARKRLKEMLEGTGVSLSKATGETNKLTKANDDLKRAQIESINALTEARRSQAQNREEHAKLRAEYIKGQRTMQEFRLEQAKLNAERKEQERQERKLQKELRQNNGEYAKMSKALNNVRNQAKNTLVEMMKLEQSGQKGSAAYQKLAHEARGFVAQTKLLDAGLKRIDATVGQHQRNVGNYASALSSISPIVSNVDMRLGAFGTSIDQLAKDGKVSLGGLANSFKTVGLAALKFLATPIGAVLGVLGSLFALFNANKRTVMDFNSGLLNVSKTTGLADRELEKLADGIINLSMELETVSTDKLLEYATIAGQLGVKGRQNILNFSEALAKLETASDISGEEGGADIARLLNLVDGGVGTVKDFGDEVVNLGNNFAATEKEILHNATAVAQNTGLYKIGRREVLAYAAATKAVGLEAEVVGSAIFRSLAQLEKISLGGEKAAEQLKILGVTQAELGKLIKDDSAGAMRMFIDRLNEVNKAGGSVTETLANLGMSNVRDVRVLGTLASSGYGELNRALEMVTDSAGAMDREFETASSKLEVQAGRLKIAWQNFVLSIENGQGAIGKAVTFIIGELATLLDAINKTFNPRSVDEFFARFTSPKQADAIRDIVVAMDDAVEVGQKLGKMDVNRSNFEALREMHDDIAEAVENLREQSEAYKSHINSGFLTNSGKYKLEELTSQLQFLGAQQHNLNRIMNGLEPTAQAGGSSSGGGGESESDAKARLAKEAREREAAARKHESEVRRRNNLQKRIDDLSKRQHIAQLDRDEREVESIRDKYARMREEVEEFYKDTSAKELKLDIAKLDTAEQKEIAEAQYRQETKALIAQLNEQRRLQQEYEKWKDEFGKESADERFKREIEHIKGFAATVNAELIGIGSEATASIDGGSVRELTAAEQERLEAIRKLKEDIQKQEEKEQQDAFMRLLKATEDYNAKRKRIIEEAEEDIATLLSEGLKENAEVRKKQMEEDLKALHQSDLSAKIAEQFRNDNDWASIFETIITLSRKASTKLLDDREKDLKALLKAGKLSADDFKKLMDDITKGRAIISDKNTFAAAIASIKQYREQVKKLGKDSKEAQKAQKEMFAAASAALHSAVEVGDAISDSMDLLNIGSESFKESFGEAIDMLAAGADLASSIASGDIGGIIAGSINVISSAIQFFNFKDKKIERRIKQYQSRLEMLGIAYDELERKISNSVGNEFYDYSKQEVEVLKERKRVLDQIIKAEEDKKKTDKDKIKALQEEIRSIDGQIQDIEKNIKDNLLQTDFKAFSDKLAAALLSAFEAGEDGIEALDKTFDDFIKNAVANSLKLNLLTPIVNKMMDDVASHMDANDKSLAGFDFTSWKKNLENATNAFNEGLAGTLEGLGIEVGEEAKGQGEIAKGIQGITESTANRLEAEFGGLRLAQLELLEVAKNTMPRQLQLSMESLEQLRSIQVNTWRTAANTERLSSIEGAIVELNNKITDTDALRRGAGL